MFIEPETSGEESDTLFESDEQDASNALHMRDDGGSSADEENRLKDFLRRNAKEERDVRIKVHKDLE